MSFTDSCMYNPGMDRKDFDQLEPHLAPLLERRRYAKGRVLWTEGERSGRLTVIDRGRVKITRARADGSAVLLYVFGPGTVFGFLPLIDDGPYPATAVAVEEVEARVVSRAAVRDAVQRDPDLAWALISVLGRRLRESFDRVEDLSHREARVRVAGGLYRLLPTDVKDAIAVVTLPGAAYIYAEELGVTPETLSRALADLERDGVIQRLGRGRYQFLDLAALQEMAGRYTPLKKPKNNRC